MTDTIIDTSHDIDDQNFSEDSNGHTHLPTNTGVSNEKLGMWVFLGSECLMFGGLISTYMLYKNRPGGLEIAPGRTVGGGATKPSDLFDIPFTSVTSFVLLASSLTMVLAVNAAGRNHMDRMRIWLGATASLGALFIGGQVYEFTTFVREGLGYTTNTASSAFFTLTGFHGIHVTIGILMLVVTIAMSLRGRIPHSRAEAVEIVGLYWHFVDVVWILIFTVVYLIK